MEHQHEHNLNLESINRAFVIGIIINALYVIIEFCAGFYFNSLSLISDAGHNLSDVAALALALLAYKLAKIKATEKYTYGYRKSTILVSLVNSVILFIAIGGILWESIERFKNPIEIEGNYVSIIAGMGIFVNAISAFLFFKNKEKDLNIKGAYLHLLADAAVSLGVVISGILISFLKIYWLDLVMSLIIVVVIFYSTWKLFKDSLSLSLDGVPKGIKLENIVSEIKEIAGVIDVHHIHVWAISTTYNAMTAHIVIKKDIEISELNRIKTEIKHELKHINIHHTTLEIEFENEKCCDNENI